MIEFIFNSELSVFITPIENGKAHYLIEIHDFSNLDGRKFKCDYFELQDIVKNPRSYIGTF